jgi:hypothetical protein
VGLLGLANFKLMMLTLLVVEIETRKLEKVEAASANRKIPGRASKHD